jgi:nitrogen fixation protein FixH
MRPVTLRLRFSGAEGRLPVRDLEVLARMPEMDHGAVPVVFRPDGAGQFVASHVFSMDGEWELEVRAVVGSRPATTRLIIRVGEP